MVLSNDLWINKIGVLPIDFLHNQSEEQKISAMLNGTTHNFCVGYDCPYVEEPAFRDKVWSANMSTYLSITDDIIKLYDIRKIQYEEIRTIEVERDVQRFYSYLSTKRLPREDSVLEFVLSRFREIRSMLREESSARNSLSLLLNILAGLSESDDIEWKLPTNDVQLDFILRNRELVNETIDRLNIGMEQLGVKPSVDMILRHCSGALFQEANFIAHFPTQLTLFPSVDFSIERNPNLVGAYFTPAYIARTIVEETLKNVELQNNLVVFDPACGSGVFLSECLRQLKSRHYSGHVSVVGWDIDEIAIDMTNFVLSFEKKEWGDRLNYSVERRDSLEIGNVWPQSDIILMNPPYISWYMMGNSQRNQVIEILGEANNKPNMSVLFYVLATRSLKARGVIGCLMPSAFLSSDSVRGVRQKVNELVPPIFIGLLGNYVFSSAYVDVCMIIAKQGSAPDTVGLLWTKNSSNVSEVALRALRRSNSSYVNLPPDYNIYRDSFFEMLKNDRWLPLSEESIRLQERLRWGVDNGWFVSVVDLFDVRQGARTGANNVFILAQEEYDTLPSAERKFFRPSVDNDAINEGVLVPVNYLFYPYPENEIGFASEEDLLLKVPIYYHRKLLPNKGKLIGRSEIDVEKWWLLTRPRAWQFETFPKLVSTEFGRSGSYSVDVKGNCVVERGMCWIPRAKEVDMDMFYFYVSILNSNFFNKLLMAYSKQLAGGAYNLETKYVNAIPLPIYSKVDSKYRELLITGGRKILCGRFDCELINSIVKNIYGTE